MSAQIDRSELLELDIDTRLVDLWQILDEDFPEFDEDERVVLASFMRAAYGAGYLHALQEPVRGRLCREHGYTVPSRPRG